MSLSKVQFGEESAAREAIEITKKAFETDECAATSKCTRKEAIVARLLALLEEGVIDRSRELQKVSLLVAYRRAVWLAETTAVSYRHQQDLQRYCYKTWSDLCKFGEIVPFRYGTTLPLQRETNRAENKSSHSSKYAKRPHIDGELAISESTPEEVVDHAPANQTVQELEPLDDYIVVNKKRPISCWDNTCAVPNDCKIKDHITWSKMCARATKTWLDKYFCCGNLENYRDVKNWEAHADSTLEKIEQPERPPIVSNKERRAIKRQKNQERRLVNKLENQHTNYVGRLKKIEQKDSLFQAYTQVYGVLAEKALETVTKAAKRAGELLKGRYGIISWIKKRFDPSIVDELTVYTAAMTFKEITDSKRIKELLFFEHKKSWSDSLQKEFAGATTYEDYLMAKNSKIPGVTKYLKDLLGHTGVQLAKDLHGCEFSQVLKHPTVKAARWNRFKKEKLSEKMRTYTEHIDSVEEFFKLIKAGEIGKAAYAFRMLGFNSETISLLRSNKELDWDSFRLLPAFGKAWTEAEQYQPLPTVNVVEIKKVPARVAGKVAAKRQAKSVISNAVQKASKPCVELVRMSAGGEVIGKLKKSDINFLGAKIKTKIEATSKPAEIDPALPPIDPLHQAKAMSIWGASSASSVVDIRGEMVKQSRQLHNNSVNDDNLNRGVNQKIDVRQYKKLVVETEALLKQSLIKAIQNWATNCNVSVQVVKLGESNVEPDCTIIALKSSGYLLREVGSYEVDLRNLIFERNKVRGQIVLIDSSNDMKLLNVLKRICINTGTVKSLKQVECACGWIYSTNQSRPTCPNKDCPNYGGVDRGDQRAILSKGPLHVESSHRHSNKTLIYCQDKPMGLEISQNVPGSVHIGSYKDSVLASLNNSDIVVTHMSQHLTLPVVKRIVLDYGPEVWKRNYVARLGGAENIYTRHSSDVAYGSFLTEAHGSKFVEIETEDIGLSLEKLKPMLKVAARKLPIMIYGELEELNALRDLMSQYDVSNVLTTKNDVIADRSKIKLVTLKPMKWMSPYIIAANDPNYVSIVTKKPLFENVREIENRISEWMELENVKKKLVITLASGRLNLKDTSVPLLQSVGADLSMGAGIAKSSLIRYARDFRDKLKGASVGTCIRVPTVGDAFDYFLVTKVKSQTPFSLKSDVESAIKDFSSKLRDTTVMMPRVECGLNGHRWEEIRSFFQQYVRDAELKVYEGEETRRTWVLKKEGNYKICSYKIEIQPQHVTNTNVARWNDYDITLKGTNPRLVVRAMLQGTFDNCIPKFDAKKISKGCSGLLLKKTKTLNPTALDWMQGSNDDYFYVIGKSRNGELVNGLHRSAHMLVSEWFADDANANKESSGAKRKTHKWGKECEDLQSPGVVGGIAQSLQNVADKLSKLAIGSENQPKRSSRRDQHRTGAPRSPSRVRRNSVASSRNASTTRRQRSRSTSRNRVKVPKQSRDQYARVKALAEQIAKTHVEVIELERKSLQVLQAEADKHDRKAGNKQGSTFKQVRPQLDKIVRSRSSSRSGRKFTKVPRKVKQSVKTFVSDAITFITVGLWILLASLLVGNVATTPASPNVKDLKKANAATVEELSHVAAVLGYQTKEADSLQTLVSKHNISKRELQTRWNYVRGNITEMTGFINRVNPSPNPEGSMENKVLSLWTAIRTQRDSLDLVISGYYKVIDMEIQHCDEMKLALNEIKQQIVRNTKKLKEANAALSDNLELEFNDMPDPSLDTLTMLELQMANRKLSQEIKEAVASMSQHTLTPSRKKRSADNSTLDSSKVTYDKNCPVRSYLGQKNSTDCCTRSSQGCSELATPIKCNTESTDKFMGPKNIGCQVAYTRKFINGKGKPMAVRVSDDTNVSCSVSCLPVDELVSLLFNQPAKPGCICPFVNKLFEIPVESSGTVSKYGFTILNKKSVLRHDIKTFTLRNKVDFNRYCCGTDKLANSESEVNYTQYHCGCKVEKTTFEMEKHRNYKSVDFIVKLGIWAMGLIIFHKHDLSLPYTAITVPIWYLFDLPLVAGSCASEHYDLSTMDSHQNSKLIRYINLFEGTCFKVGTKTHRVKNIITVYDYQFMASLPTKIHEACHSQQYECGGAAEVCTTALDSCKATCKKAGGLYYDICMTKSGNLFSNCLLHTDITIGANLCLVSKVEELVSVYEAGIEPVKSYLVLETDESGVFSDVEYEVGEDSFEKDLSITNIIFSQDHVHNTALRLNNFTKCLSRNIDLGSNCRSTSSEAINWADQTCSHAVFTWNPKDKVMNVAYEDGIGQQIWEEATTCNIESSTSSGNSMQLHVRRKSARATLIAKEYNDEVTNRCDEVTTPKVIVTPGKNNFWTSSNVAIKGTVDGTCVLVVDPRPCFSVSSQRAIVTGNFDKSFEIVCGVNMGNNITIKLSSKDLVLKTEGLAISYEYTFKRKAYALNSIVSERVGDVFNFGKLLKFDIIPNLTHVIGYGATLMGSAITIKFIFEQNYIFAIIFGMGTGVLWKYWVAAGVVNVVVAPITALLVGMLILEPSIITSNISMATFLFLLWTIIFEATDNEYHVHRILVYYGLIRTIFNSVIDYVCKKSMFNSREAATVAINKYFSRITFALLLNELRVSTDVGLTFLLILINLNLDTGFLRDCILHRSVNIVRIRQDLNWNVLSRYISYLVPIRFSRNARSEIIPLLWPESDRTISGKLIAQHPLASMRLFLVEDKVRLCTQANVLKEGDFKNEKLTNDCFISKINGVFVGCAHVLSDCECEMCRCVEYNGDIIGPARDLRLGVEPNQLRSGYFMEGIGVFSATIQRQNETIYIYNFTDGANRPNGVTEEEWDLLLADFQVKKCNNTSQPNALNGHQITGRFTLPKVAEQAPEEPLGFLDIDKIEEKLQENTWVFNIYHKCRFFNGFKEGGDVVIFTGVAKYMSRLTPWTGNSCENMTLFYKGYNGFYAEAKVRTTLFTMAPDGYVITEKEQQSREESFFLSACTWGSKPSDNFSKKPEEFYEKLYSLSGENFNVLNKVNWSKVGGKYITAYHANHENWFPTSLVQDDIICLGGNKTWDNPVGILTAAKNGITYTITVVEVRSDILKCKLKISKTREFSGVVGLSGLYFKNANCDLIITDGVTIGDDTYISLPLGNSHHVHSFVLWDAWHSKCNTANDGKHKFVIGNFPAYIIRSKNAKSVVTLKGVILPGQLNSKIAMIRVTRVLAFACNNTTDPTYNRHCEALKSCPVQYTYTFIKDRSYTVRVSTNRDDPNLIIQTVIFTNGVYEDLWIDNFGIWHYSDETDAFVPGMRYCNEPELSGEHAKVFIGSNSVFTQPPMYIMAADMVQNLQGLTLTSRSTEIALVFEGDIEAWKGFKIDNLSTGSGENSYTKVLIDHEKEDLGGSKIVQLYNPSSAKGSSQYVLASYTPDMFRIMDINRNYFKFYTSYENHIFVYLNNGDCQFELGEICHELTSKAPTELTTLPQGGGDGANNNDITSVEVDGDNEVWAINVDDERLAIKNLREKIVKHKDNLNYVIDGWHNISSANIVYLQDQLSTVPDSLRGVKIFFTYGRVPPKNDLIYVNNHICCVSVNVMRGYALNNPEAEDVDRVIERFSTDLDTAISQATPYTSVATDTILSEGDAEEVAAVGVEPDTIEEALYRKTCTDQESLDLFDLNLGGISINEFCERKNISAVKVDFNVANYSRDRPKRQEMGLVMLLKSYTLENNNVESILDSIKVKRAFSPLHPKYFWRLGNMQSEIIIETDYGFLLNYSEATLVRLLNMATREGIKSLVIYDNHNRSSKLLEEVIKNSRYYILRPMHELVVYYVQEAADSRGDSEIVDVAIVNNLLNNSRTPSCQFLKVDALNWCTDYPWNDSADFFTRTHDGSRYKADVEVNSGCERVDVSKIEYSNLPDFLKVDCFWGATCVSLTNRGMIYGLGINASTNYHVTMGNNVTLTRKISGVEQTIEWSNPKVNKEVDICVYGNQDFEAPEYGEIVCMYDIVTNTKCYFVSESLNVKIEDNMVSYNLFVGVELNRTNKTIVRIDMPPLYGMSGSPLINMRGKICGIFGNSAVCKNNDGTFRLTLLTIPSMDITKLDMYFSRAAEETFTLPLERDKWRLMLEAPTGTGKSTRYPLELLKHAVSRGITDFKIVMLEPMRTAARNVFLRLKERVIEENLEDKVTVDLSLGRSTTEVNSDVIGDGRIRLSIMTYGKFKEEYFVQRTAFKPNIVLMDECHMRSDKTVVLMTVLLSMERYINTGPIEDGSTMKSRIVLMTATNSGFSNTMRLCGDEVLTTTNSAIVEKVPIKIDPNMVDFDVSEFIRIPLSKLKSPDGSKSVWTDYLVQKMDFEGARMIIFLDTISNVKKCTKLMKKLNPNIPVFEYYSGAKPEFETTDSTSIIVSTDVLGVSVTVRNCGLVFDACHENKPRVKLVCSNSDRGEFSYVNQMQSMLISKHTSTQRKGRTGRDRAGFYIPITNQFKNDVAYPEEALAEVMVDLWTLSHDTRIDEILDEGLKEVLQEKSWMIEVGNNWLKKNLLNNIDGDKVFLFLTNVLLKKWVAVQKGNTEDDQMWHHKADLTSQQAWVTTFMRDVKDKIAIVETELELTRFQEATRRIIISQKEKCTFDDSKINYEALATTAHAKSAIRKYEMLLEGSEYEPSELSIPSVGSSTQQGYWTWYIAVGAIASLATVGAVSSIAVQRYGRRHIVELWWCKKYDLAKIVTQASLIDFEQIKKKRWITTFFTDVDTYIKKWWDKMSQFFSTQNKGTTKQSANAFIGSIYAWCMANVPQIMTVISAGGSLLGSVMGYNYDQIVQCMGEKTAFCLVGSVIATLTLYGGIWPGLVFTLTSVIGYIVRSKTTDLSVANMITGNNEGKRGASLFWGGLLAATIGTYTLSGFGNVQNFGTAMSVVTKTGVVSLAISAQPRQSPLSAGVIIVKTIWATYKHAIGKNYQDYQASVMVSNLGTLLLEYMTTYKQLPFMTLFTCFGIGVSVCGLHYLLTSWVKSEMLLNVEKSRDTDRDGGKKMADWLYQNTQKFEHVIDSVISVLAVAASPSSAILIVIDLLRKLWEGETLQIPSILESARDWAGVNFILGLLTMMLQTIWKHRGEQSVPPYVMWASVIAGIPAAAGGLLLSWRWLISKPSDETVEKLTISILGRSVLTNSQLAECISAKWDPDAMRKRGIQETTVKWICWYIFPMARSLDYNKPRFLIGAIEKEGSETLDLIWDNLGTSKDKNMLDIEPWVIKPNNTKYYDVFKSCRGCKFQDLSTENKGHVKQLVLQRIYDMIGQGEAPSFNITDEDGWFTTVVKYTTTITSKLWWYLCKFYNWTGDIFGAVFDSLGERFGKAMVRSIKDECGPIANAVFKSQNREVESFTGITQEYLADIDTVENAELYIKSSLFGTNSYKIISRDWITVMTTDIPRVLGDLRASRRVLKMLDSFKGTQTILHKSIELGWPLDAFKQLPESWGYQFNTFLTLDSSGFNSVVNKELDLEITTFWEVSEVLIIVKIGQTLNLVHITGNNNNCVLTVYVNTYVSYVIKHILDEVISRGITIKSTETVKVEDVDADTLFTGIKDKFWLSLIKEFVTAPPPGLFSRACTSLGVIAFAAKHRGMLKPCNRDYKKIINGEIRVNMLNQMNNYYLYFQRSGDDSLADRAKHWNNLCHSLCLNKHTNFVATNKTRVGTFVHLSNAWYTTFTQGAVGLLLENNRLRICRRIKQMENLHWSQLCDLTQLLGWWEFKIEPKDVTMSVSMFDDLLKAWRINLIIVLETNSYINTAIGECNCCLIIKKFSGLVAASVKNCDMHVITNKNSNWSIQNPIAIKQAVEVCLPNGKERCKPFNLTENGNILVVPITKWADTPKVCAKQADSLTIETYLSRNGVQATSGERVQTSKNGNVVISKVVGPRIRVNEEQIEELESYVGLSHPRALKIFSVAKKYEQSELFCLLYPSSTYEDKLLKSLALKIEDFMDNFKFNFDCLPKQTVDIPAEDRFDDKFEDALDRLQYLKREWYYNFDNIKNHSNNIFYYDRYVEDIFDIDLPLSYIQEQLTSYNRLFEKLPIGVSDKVQHVYRVRPPKRTLNVTDEDYYSYASRGAFKLQQLDEFDRDLINVNTVWDLTSGYGGYAQYYSWKHAKSENCLYVCNSLNNPKHRQMIPSFVNVAGSQVKVIGISHNTSGDIRDPDVSSRLKQLASVRKPKLLIFDFGELSTNIEKEGDFYFKTAYGKKTIDAVCESINHLETGGTLLFKLLGVNSKTTQILERLLVHFKRWYAYKMPTASNGSREWYLIAKNKLPKTRPISHGTVENFLRPIKSEISLAMSRAYGLLRNAKYIKILPKIRDDWFKPNLSSKIAYRMSDKRLPDGVEVNINYLSSKQTGLISNFSCEFKSNLEARIDLVKSRIKSARANFEILPVYKDWKEMVGLGTYRTKITYDKPRHVSNSVISDYCSDVFGWTPATGTYGWTQTTEEFMNECYEKRLDYNPGHPDTDYVQLLLDTLDTMPTDQAREKFGSLNLLSKSDVEKMINNKGATGKFAGEGNLKQYLTAHEDWYERGLSRVLKWAEGIPTDSYWTIRAKKEATKRRDIDAEGHLQYFEPAGDVTTTKRAIIVPSVIAERVTIDNKSVIDVIGWDHCNYRVSRDIASHALEKSFINQWVANLGQKSKRISKFKVALLPLPQLAIKMQYNIIGTFIPSDKLIAELTFPHEIKEFLMREIDDIKSLGIVEEVHSLDMLRNKINSTEKFKRSDIAEYETMLQGGNNVPRVIQFADEETRIAHMIALGQLVNLHAKEKTYKGSITGTSPHLVGNISRAVWDLYTRDPNKKIVSNKSTAATGITIVGDDTLGSPDSKGVIIYAGPGSGKTQLKARLSKEYSVADTDEHNYKLPLKHYDIILTNLIEEVKNKNYYTIAMKYKPEEWRRRCSFKTNVDPLVLDQWVEDYKDSVDKADVVIGCEEDIICYIGNLRAALRQLKLKSDNLKTGCFMVDFSKFDKTQTVFDRMMESKFYKQFYPPSLHKMIDNMLSEMAYPLCFDDYGNFFTREGQRSSGEITTSIGNTLLANVHTRAAICYNLGISPHDLFATKGKIIFPATSDAVKVFEYQDINVIFDGDDGFVSGPRNIIRRLSKSMDEPYGKGNKIARSGNKSGVTYIETFAKLEFCSHSYQMAIVGSEAQEYNHLTEHEKLAKAIMNRDRVYYLPTRGVQFIIGKAPTTLKTSTKRVLEQDGTFDVDGVSITRGKCLSYLLLYPHIRTTRLMCLSILAVLGEGEWEIDRNRWGEQTFSGKTISSALYSLFKITNLKYMSTINLESELKQLQVLSKNARLVDKPSATTIRGVAIKSEIWAQNYSQKYKLTPDDRIRQIWSRE